MADERRSSTCSSVDFEFSIAGGGEGDHHEILTADELFADGVLLPLRLLPFAAAKEPNHPGPAEESVGLAEDLPVVVPRALEEDTVVLAGTAAATSEASSPKIVSKRWREMFKVAEKKAAEDHKERRRERKLPAAGAPELSIGFWPFARSHSAGNAGNRKPRSVVAMASRKASSAPCSRSNSRGESSRPQRRWAASPGRAGGGVPLGRSSPVWQFRRPAITNSKAPSAELDRPSPKSTRSPSAVNKRSAAGTGVSVVRGLNLSVNSCIGYRHQVSCRRADGDTAAGQGVTADAGVGGGGGLFGLKNLFSKRVVQ